MRIPLRHALVACLLVPVLALASSVSVKTQKIGESANSVSVNAVITNTGPDTLRELRYVWMMDWSDHGAGIVPELDWASVSGVTRTVELRPDYLAEVSYRMSDIALAPGESVQLNTRLHLANWTSFHCGNDWSYLGQKPGLTENGNVEVFGGSEKLWGTVPRRVDQTPIQAKVDVVTQKTQESPNTLGLQVVVKNVGNVPLTHVSASWIGQVRSNDFQAVVDWTDAAGLKVSSQGSLEGKSYLNLDLDTAVLAVGGQRTIQLRLYAPDETVDWSQDWSYAGLSSVAANAQVSTHVEGYPTSGMVFHRDTVVSGVGIKDGFVSDSTSRHQVTYDFSSLPGYSSRNSVPATIAQGAVLGWVPTLTVADRTGIPAPTFKGALSVGKILDVTGAIVPDHQLSMPIPLPDGLNVNADRLQILHYTQGAWVREPIDSVAHGAIYANVHSLSPFAVGVIQQANDLAAGGAHLLSIDKQGVLWSAGANERGQLGARSGVSSSLGLLPVIWPRQIAAVAVSAGAQFSLALDAAGNVWAWGDNAKGQCARAITNAFFNEPVLAVDASQDSALRVIQVVAGDSAGYALTIGGQVLSWGANAHAQLGRAPTVLVDTVPAFVTGLTGVRSVAAGTRHVLALLGSGELMGWGAGSDGQFRGTQARLEVPTLVPMDPNVYGVDTIYPSGCYGCMLTFPIYDGPSFIGAGGNMSYAKLYNNRSANNAALNLVWGGNGSGQISPKLGAVVTDPQSVSWNGKNDIALGVSHILETWYAGYSGGQYGVTRYYPVRARGNNSNKQSDPTSTAVATDGWKEVHATDGKRLQSSWQAAGREVSASYNYVLDSVQAWGGIWKTVQCLKTANDSFLEIVWPKSGDTLPTVSKEKLQVQVRIWKGGVAGEPLYIRPSIGAGSPSTLTATRGAATATVSVVFADAPPVSLAAHPVWDMRSEGVFRLQVRIPVPVSQASLSFARLQDSTFDTVITKVKMLNLQPGIQTFPVPNDGSVPLPDGSYRVRLEYKPQWDTTQMVIQKLTTVSAVDWSTLPIRRTLHGIPWAGPDSFVVTTANDGVLQPRASSYQGQLVQGAWDLLPAGENRVSIWNIGLDGKTVVGEGEDLPLYWNFRPVTNGLRVKGSACTEWTGMNSHHIESFYSQVAIPKLDTKSGCQPDAGMWNGASGTNVFGPVNGIFGDWPISLPMSGVWVLGNRDTKMSVGKE